MNLLFTYTLPSGSNLGEGVEESQWLLCVCVGGWGRRPEEPEGVVCTRDEERRVSGLTVDPRPIGDGCDHTSWGSHNPEREEGLMKGRISAVAVVPFQSLQLPRHNVQFKLVDRPLVKKENGQCNTTRPMNVPPTLLSPTQS